MWEKSTPFSDTSRSSGIKVLAVWDVEAGPEYDIHWPEEKEDIVYPDSYAVVYTMSGRGKIYTDNHEPMDLQHDTVMFLECETIQRYHCVGDSWRFHWFEFGLTGAMQMPLNSAIAVLTTEGYSKTFYEITRQLQQNTPAYRRLAAANITALLYEWLTHHEDQAQASPHLKLVQSIINEMHSRIGGNWTVGEMAGYANMSEQNFRKNFRSLTGKSPKKFYMDIKLSSAADLLKKGTYTVSEIAYTLGFSDPFHFSKEFKKYSGIPPSKFRAESRK